MYKRLMAAATMLVLTTSWSSRVGAVDFVNFESGQVRPLALTAAGDRLLAVNTPDNRLEIFAVRTGGLVHEASVPVGLEPIAVALRSDSEAWVVNHLSDSVSIVSLSGVPRVTRTLLVGDEPRDVVFAGGDRAFITSAHRGQQRTDPSIAAVPGAGDPALADAGVGRADVWVFDATSLGSEIGGLPLRIIELFGDTPRALTVSPDGTTVYAAVFLSGNRTAVVTEQAVCDGFGTAPCNGDGITSPGGLVGGLMPGGMPGPATNVHGDPAPETGLVVQLDQASGEWRDTEARNWSNAIRFNLPDEDVFAIDAQTLEETDSYRGVGTVLFNMVSNPVSGKIYVTNTDAQNLTRFEGPGTFGGSTVQGNLHQARITVLDGTSVSPRHLNKHIDYSVMPAPAGVKTHSLATPLGMAISDDGSTLYVAAFGSARIGVFDTAELENDSFDPTLASAAYIDLDGGGPTGLVIDESNDRLYSLTRFNNSVAIVDTQAGVQVGSRPLHNPEPVEVTVGRPLLYDADFTSSNGEASCSSCHIFGDFDALAWDLGDPDGEVIDNPIPINGEAITIALNAASPTINGSGALDELHPMKGPMTTQTLRGMVNSGAMHWRGDRSVGVFGTDAFDSRLSFNNFNVAFPDLLGRDSVLSVEDMNAYTDFALSIALPPNPVRKLDNSLTVAEQAGRDFFLGSRRSDGSPIDVTGEQDGFTCDGCHVLDASEGFFGTGGNSSFEGGEQVFKIPQLRNLYQKVGMFGMPDVGSFNPGNNDHKGEQVRGSGFLHDGGTDTLFRFFNAIGFNEVTSPFGPVGFPDTQARLDMEQFMFAFDSDIAPIVGQQITLDIDHKAVVDSRIDLLLARAATPFVSKILGGSVTEADVVAAGYVDGMVRSYVRLADGKFQSDDSDDEPLSASALRDLVDAFDESLTFTAVPPGSGMRIGVDRDRDGVYNAVDVCPATADSSQLDDDSDGRGNPCDNCALDANSDQLDTDGDGLGNACDDDADGDGMSNDFETINSLDLLDPDDADEDPDNDGLTNLEEFQISPLMKTNDADTDDDGIGDALDMDPIVYSNGCTGGDADNATLGQMIDSRLTCAAQVSIDVEAATQVTFPDGDLHLISPTVSFQSGFKVSEGGRLTVISADPCPGCSQ